MNLFDLAVKLKLDDGEFSSGIENAKGIAQGFGSKAASTMKGIGAAGVAAFAAAETAVVAFGKESVETGMGFDAAMSQVAATMGITAQQIAEGDERFKALRDTAKDMGATTNYSATQAADGLNILAMSGYDAEESISMIEDVLHLAGAGGLTLANSAAYISGAMKGFADETKDAQYYADLFAKGATLANTNVNDLALAMSDGAATAAAYNQTQIGLGVALLRLAEQGETGSAAATALNRAMADLYTPTNDAKGALEELGVSAYDLATGEARDINEVMDELNSTMAALSQEERNAYLSTIFTAQGLSAFNKMTVSSTEKTEQFRDALMDAAGSASEQYATMTANLKGDLDIWNSSVEGFQIAISDKLTPTIREFVSFGSGSVSEITQAFEQNGLEAAMNVFGDKLIAGVGMIGGKLPEFANAGAQIVGGVLNAFIENAGNIGTAAGTLVGNVANAVLTAAMDPGTYATLGQAALNIVGGLADGITSAVAAALAGNPLIKAVQDQVNELLEWTNDKMFGGAGSGGELMNDVNLSWDQMGITFSDSGAQLAAESMLQNLADALASGKISDPAEMQLDQFIDLEGLNITEAEAGAIYQKAAALLNSQFDGLNAEGTSAGVNLGTGLEQGILSQQGKVMAAARRLADAAASEMRSALKIASPSKVSREDGVFFGSGLAIGITDTERDVVQAAHGIAAAADNTLRSFRIGYDSISSFRPVDAVDQRADYGTAGSIKELTAAIRKLQTTNSSGNYGFYVNGRELASVTRTDTAVQQNARRRRIAAGFGR